jgi:hypothetical protein
LSELPNALLTLRRVKIVIEGLALGAINRALANRRNPVGAHLRVRLRYRADTQVGPYSRIRDDDDTVKMIRYDYELLGFDHRKVAVQFQPPMFSILPASFNRSSPSATSPKQYVRVCVRFCTSCGHVRGTLTACSLARA